MIVLFEHGCSIPGYIFHWNDNCENKPKLECYFESNSDTQINKCYKCYIWYSFDNRVSGC